MAPADMLFDLRSLGWKAFQDLCAAVASEVLGRPVQTFLPSRDGGRDGAFVGTWDGAPNSPTAKSTVQCKFSSVPGASLTLPQVSSELAKVTRLAKRGLAHDYIIMTNAGVSGEAEAKICEAVKEAGATQCRVFDGGWISQQLRERQRLRMMIPRVYGIGDLAQIITGNAYEQARYILSSMGDDLGCFVPTEAHRRAVEAMNSYGFVLLLGDPASGKSTIAATIALGALDGGCSGALKITSPDQLNLWLPHEKQFLWVDDAFGPNQIDSNRVNGWNAELPRLRAAVRNGTKIVFTSRNYIWEAARRQIRTSQFPLLGESQVVVNVQELTRGERAQILYNHLKLGGQPKDFRTRLKPFLPAIAVNDAFLPETARRLGDPMFTRRLVLAKSQLTEFVEHPVGFLKDVLEKLDDPSRAAIALIFLHPAGGVRSPIGISQALEMASRLMGVKEAEIARALENLNGSLTLLVADADGARWVFRHPTVTDAFAALVAESPELVELYVRGAKIDRLLTEVVCGPIEIQGAKVRVPSALYGVLLDRLQERAIDRELQVFLASKCEPAFLGMFIQRRPEIFELSSKVNSDLAYSSETTVLAALHRAGLLPESVRQPLVTHIEDLSLTWADAGAFVDEDIKCLFTPDEFEELSGKFQVKWIDDLDKTVDRWGSDFSSSDEISHYEGLKDSLSRAEIYFGNSENAHAFAVVYERITDLIADLEADRPTDTAATLAAAPVSRSSVAANIFDDVDA